MRDYIQSSKLVIQDKQAIENIDLDIDFNKYIKYLQQQNKQQIDSSNSDNQYKEQMRIQYQKVKQFIKYGQNVICYGKGSLINFLHEIVFENFKEHPVLEIKGYQQSLTFKTIQQNLAKIISIMLKEELNNKKRAQFLQTYINENIKRISPQKIIVLFHSLDGKALRNAQTQFEISKLAQFPEIIFVASFNHIKYNLLLSQQAQQNFNFAYIEANTDQIFLQEIKNLKVSGQQKRDKLIGLKYIMKSLTKNQKDIVKLLAKWILEHPLQTGLNFQELWDQVCEDMIVTSKQVLKDCLLEIIDHEVFVIDEKNKFYTMTYEPKILLKIVNDQLDQEQEGDVEEQKGSDQEDSEQIIQNRKNKKMYNTSDKEFNSNDEIYDEESDSDKDQKKRLNLLNQIDEDDDSSEEQVYNTVSDHTGTIL